MSVYEKGLLTVLAVSALLVLIALPLIFGKVPRNRWYGYRTRATLSDDALWFAANAYFGKRLLLASLAGATGIVFLYFWNGLAPDGFLRASILLLAAPPGLAALLTHLFVRAQIRARHRSEPPSSLH